jgi:hypothetical protein
MRLPCAAFLKGYPNSERPTIRIIAVTNAGFASLHGLPVALLPFDDARSAPQTARSSRACMVQGRWNCGLPSAARRRVVLLRLRSTFPARRPQTEARFILSFPASDKLSLHFQRPTQLPWGGIRHSEFFDHPIVSHVAIHSQTFCLGHEATGLHSKCSSRCREVRRISAR